MVMKHSNVQILILRLVLGVLFLFAGAGKVSDGWLTNEQPLQKSLDGYHQRAAGIQLTYLDNVALPHTALWAKLMAIGETAVGISLLLGLLTRFSSLVGLFMVFNFHAANGNLFSLNFFQSAWAALIVASFLIVYLAKGGHWFGLDAILAERNFKWI